MTREARMLVVVVLAFFSGAVVALVATQLGVIPAALVYAIARAVIIPFEPDDDE